MPILKSEFFDLDEQGGSLKERILEFLRENKDKAYKIAEISSELDIPVTAISPYLNLFKEETIVIHRGKYWLYDQNFKEKEKVFTRVFKRKETRTDENTWGVIKNYLEKNNKLQLISPAVKGQTFEVIELNDFFIKILFSESRTIIKIEKSRFLSAYNLLKEKKGEWVKIGASRVGTNPETLEGRIKKEHGGNMNGFSTATWIATILVRAFDNIGFNGKMKGQALRME